MQAIASRLWGPTSSWHPGGMAWQLATEQSPGVMRVWDGAAWGWMYQPDVLLLQVDAAAPELAAEVVAWFDAANTGTAPRVETAEGQDHVVAALVAAGYSEVTDEAFGLDQRCAAERTKVRLPRGYALNTAADVTDEVRINAHRDAWLPRALPYVPELRPFIAEDATSGFDEAKLARTRATPPYAAARDFVITTADGAPAACATVWFDESTGSAEIEPLGVAPEHRRRGLAQALCHAALDAVARAGGSEVVIHPRGDAAYPAPRGAYSAAGFKTVNRTRIYGR
jgi:ribosomal protein S18 acetylase RimI-like enzyme